MRPLALGLLALFASTSVALAHAFLNHANPGAGATLHTSPRVVALEFSEELEPTFSGAAVTDSTGRDVAASPSTATGARMEVKLKALKPGSYRVSWHALSVDTHRTEGSFTFTIRP
jgi:methionine-rich copper-binding protein CopC